MKMNKIVVGFMVIFLLLTMLSLIMVSAQTLTTNLNRGTYTLNETVLATSIIKNDGIRSANWVFVGYLYSDNPEVSIPRTFVESVELLPGQSKTVEFDFSTNLILFEGVYEVRANLFDSNYNPLNQTSVQFQLVDAIKPLDITVSSYKDQARTEKTKIFLINENIYLDYDSKVSDLTINATLTLPDKTKQQLSLPKSIIAEQTGTYELEVTASKSGYKTITKKEQFGVIGKRAYIPLIQVCNVNAICDNACIVQNETGYNITADSVDAEILKPDNSIEWVTLMEGLVLHYNGTFTNTSLNGTYNATIYANKTGYVNDTAELSFFVIP
jgi:hypothetical protein